MKTILVTGGTVFVSRYVAEYYVRHGYKVYVLNRDTRAQSEGVNLIKGDRHDLGDKLKGIHFDCVMDVTAYNDKDIISLVEALDSFDQYIMVSSSAVYPDTGSQPFKEEGTLGVNKFWGRYGTDKIAAEKALLQRVPDAYILRPPYLYGPMNNVYREAFVFECALQDRAFYLPKDGSMKLQFLHVEDLCKFMEVLMTQRPEEHVFNVGNREAISIKDWVELCYGIVQKKVDYIYVDSEIEQRNYFSFYDYDYYLDVEKQYALMPETIPLEEGLKEAFLWYQSNRHEVREKPFMAFIDEKLKRDVYVRLLAVEDADKLFEFENENRDYFDRIGLGRSEAYYDRASFQKLLEELVAEQGQEQHYMYLVFNNEDKVVGRINLTDIVRGALCKAEIGYRIGEAYQRKGFASEGVALVLEKARDVHKLHRIEAGTGAENVGSQQILLKNGFREVGKFEQYILVNGKWVDSLIFEKIIDVSKNE